MDLGPVRRQSLIGFFSSIGITIIGFLATIYIAHTTGPVALGAFYLLLSYLALLSLFTDCGVGGAALQKISEGRNQPEYYSAHAVIRSILLASLIAALLLARPIMVDLDSSGLFVWLLIALTAGTGASIVANGIYGSGKAGIFQVSDLIGSIVRVAFQITAVWLGYAAGGLAAGFVAGIIAGLLINCRYLGFGMVRFGIGRARELISPAVLIFAIGVTGMITSVADTILTGYFLDTASVGFYRTALQLASLSLLTGVAVRTAIYPRFARWQEEGFRNLIEEALARAFTWSLFLAIPASVGGWILGGPLLYYIYGAPFEQAAPALTVLFASQIASVFAATGSMTLLSLNRRKPLLAASAATSGIAVILNLALIPLAGIAGAAIANLGATVLSAVLVFSFLRRDMRIRIEKMPVCAILIASSAMGAAVFLYRLIVPLTSVAMVIGAVILGITMYILIVFRLDQTLREEIDALTAAFGLRLPGWL
jgi:O-antigen/teichoic acid export membrane protein